MNLKEVKTLIVGTIKQSFTNKKTLDKFDGASGTLKYNGVPVNNVPVFVADDSPVGNIIAFMGNVAPQDYLICDGTVYNITDYPLLAQHFIDEFGSVNYFGGDGETTFAVPDLRGEFLRGTGTAVRNTGSGAGVGVHQDGTYINNTQVNTTNNPASLVMSHEVSSNHDNKKIRDTNISYVTKSATNSNDSRAYLYSTRPTNTSVLYCIKYQITQNNISKDMVNYSLEEQVVGSWINGKPIYRRVFKYTVTSDWEVAEQRCTQVNALTSSSDIDFIVKWQIPNDNLSLSSTLTIRRYEYLYVSSNNINICIINSNTKTSQGNTLVCIVEYTKTTDAENSFTPDMLSNISTLNTTASDEEVNEVIGGI